MTLIFIKPNSDLRNIVKLQAVKQSGQTFCALLCIHKPHATWLTCCHTSKYTSNTSVPANAYHGGKITLQVIPRTEVKTFINSIHLKA